MELKDLSLEVSHLDDVRGGFVSITGQGNNTLTQSAAQISVPVSFGSSFVYGIGDAAAANTVTAPQTLTQNAQLIDSDSWVFNGNVFS